MKISCTYRTLGDFLRAALKVNVARKSLVGRDAVLNSLSRKSSKTQSLYIYMYVLYSATRVKLHNRADICIYTHVFASGVYLHNSKFLRV